MKLGHRRDTKSQDKEVAARLKPQLPPLGSKRRLKMYGTTPGGMPLGVVIPMEADKYGKVKGIYGKQGQLLIG